MIIKIALTLFLSLASVCGQAEVVVVGNLKNGLKSLSVGQVQDIFMGRSRLLPNGKFVLPLDQASLRPDFYQKLTARPIEQINAYWARIIFSGQGSPPAMLPDDQAVLKTVSENEGAIGYVNKASVAKDVRILLGLN